MSRRREQRRSLLYSREFFRWLLENNTRWTKEQLRQEAYHCLRHFPYLQANGEPLWSQDEDETDKRF
jgi:hypothetical protein